MKKIGLFLNKNPYEYQSGHIILILKFLVFSRDQKEFSRKFFINLHYF